MAILYTKINNRDMAIWPSFAGMNLKIAGLSLFTLLFIIDLSAQSTSCDGTRYLHEVFGTTKVSTHLYGRNATVLKDSIGLYMDIYEPEGDQAKSRAALVLAFGGAYISGDRTQLSDLARTFARQGYVVACIDYRIWPLFVLSFPDSAAVVDIAIKAMGDMKASIRFLRSKADQFKIDTSLIFAGGVSAGAITAIQSVYLDSSDSIPSGLKAVIERNGGLQGSSNPQTLNYSSSVRGVLNLSGGIFDTSWIDRREPPMASMHGQADNVVPYGDGAAAGLVHIFGSGVIHPVLRSKNITETLVSVPGGMHTDIYFEPQFKPYLDSFTNLAYKMFFDIICPQVVASHHEHPMETIRIFPNPAIDHISLDPRDIPLQVNLYDLLGRSIPVTLNSNRVEWSPSAVVNGVYILQARFRNQEIKIAKIQIRL